MGAEEIQHDHEFAVVEVEGGDTEICTIYHEIGYTEIGQTRADAKLIAASPEMLKMLNKVLDIIYDEHCETDDFVGLGSKIETLIKKATK